MNAQRANGEGQHRGHAEHDEDRESRRHSRRADDRKVSKHGPWCRHVGLPTGHRHERSHRQQRGAGGEPDPIPRQTQPRIENRDRDGKRRRPWNRPDVFDEAARHRRQPAGRDPAKPGTGRDSARGTPAGRGRAGCCARACAEQSTVGPRDAPPSRSTPVRARARRSLPPRPPA